MSVDLATAKRRTTPNIPRSEWSKHDNFPDQVLLLGSHESFRRVSRHLIHVVEDGSDFAGPASLYRMWIRGMRSHESYEEHKLYPYLSRRWGVAMQALRDGHEQLHEADDEVRAAFQQAMESAEAGSSRARVVSALRAHDDVLVEHLRLEEDVVIPLLLELEPDEFADYCLFNIERLLAQLPKVSAGE